MPFKVNGHIMFETHDNFQVRLRFRALSSVYLPAVYQPSCQRQKQTLPILRSGPHIRGRRKTRMCLLLSNRVFEACCKSRLQMRESMDNQRKHERLTSATSRVARHFSLTLLRTAVKMTRQGRTTGKLMALKRPSIWTNLTSILLWRWSCSWPRNVCMKD